MEHLEQLEVITVLNALTWDSNGAVIIPISLNIQSTAGLIGTTTNNDADAGSVGEVIQSTVLSSSPINLTSSANAAITSISLTAGDWDVFANILILPTASTNMSSIGGWLNTTSATVPFPLPQSSLFSLTTTFTTGTSQSFPIGQVRYSLSTTTTIYLNVFVSFTVSTCQAAGCVFARRRR